MSVQLELLKTLHANFSRNVRRKMDVLQFKFEIIQVYTILAGYSFYCNNKFIALQLKGAVNEIALISSNACTQKSIRTEHLLEVLACLDIIIMLVKENEKILN